MKGEAQLWQILNDKFETLRAGQRLDEAIRIGQTALEIASRIFPENHPSLGLSYARLGQLFDQQGNRAEAKPYLLKALRIAERAEPPDQAAIYRRARRLAYLCDVLAEQEQAVEFYEKAIKAGSQLGNVLHTELGTLLNNVALIYRRSGRQQAAEPYYLHALEHLRKTARPKPSRCRRRPE